MLNITDAVDIVDKIPYRVYKLSISTELLTDKNFLPNFFTAVYQLAEKLGIATTVKDKKSPTVQIREVSFYDTENYDLYRRGFSLRKRSHYQTTATHIKKKTDFTLKFRHTNKAIAAKENCYAEAAKSTIYFKKQLLNSKANKTTSLYSHSVTIAFSPWFLQQGISGLGEVFPSLINLSIDPKAELHKVNQITIKESVIHLCQMRFDKHVVANAVMIVWQNHATKVPLAVEFELRAKLEKPGEFSKKAKKLLKTYYQSLQTVAHDWLSQGTTKTALIYYPKHHE